MHTVRSVCTVLCVCTTLGLAACSGTATQMPPGVARELAFGEAVDLDDPALVWVALLGEPVAPDRAVLTHLAAQANSEFFRCVTREGQDWDPTLAMGEVVLEADVGPEGGVRGTTVVFNDFQQPLRPLECAEAVLAEQRFGRTDDGFTVRVPFAVGAAQLTRGVLEIDLTFGSDAVSFSSDDLRHRVRTDRAVNACMTDARDDAAIVMEVTLDGARVARASFAASGGAVAPSRALVDCVTAALGALEVSALDTRSHTLVLAVDPALRGRSELTSPAVLTSAEVVDALDALRTTWLTQDLQAVLRTPGACLVWQRTERVDVQVTFAGRLAGFGGLTGCFLDRLGEPIVRGTGRSVDIILDIESNAPTIAD